MPSLALRADVVICVMSSATFHGVLEEQRGRRSQPASLHWLCQAGDTRPLRDPSGTAHGQEWRRPS